jgi:hypothetical protein
MRAARTPRFTSLCRNVFSISRIVLPLAELSTLEARIYSRWSYAVQSVGVAVFSSSQPCCGTASTGRPPCQSEN